MKAQEANPQRVGLGFHRDPRGPGPTGADGRAVGAVRPVPGRRVSLFLPH